LTEYLFIEMQSYKKIGISEREIIGIE